MAIPALNPKTVEVLLDTTWRLAEAEDARTESLDRKATSLATFASLVASLTATLGTSFLGAVEGIVGLGIYGLGLGLLMGALVMATRVLLPTEHLTLAMPYVRRFSRWSELIKRPEQVRGETIYGLTVAIAKERETNSRKSKQVRIALLLITAGLAVVVGEALILGAREVS